MVNVGSLAADQPLTPTPGLMANKGQVQGSVREELMEALSEAIRRVLPLQLPTASRNLGSRIYLQAEKLRLRVVNKLDGSTGEQPASQPQKAWSVP